MQATMEVKWSLANLKTVNLKLQIFLELALIAAYSFLYSSPIVPTFKISIAVRAANLVLTIFHYNMVSSVTIAPSEVIVLRKTVGSLILAEPVPEFPSYVNLCTYEGISVGILSVWIVKGTIFTNLSDTL